jgi:hypothetical protein
MQLMGYFAVMLFGWSMFSLGAAAGIGAWFKSSLASTLTLVTAFSLTPFVSIIGFRIVLGVIAPESCSCSLGMWVTEGLASLRQFLTHPIDSFRRYSVEARTARPS